LGRTFAELQPYPLYPLDDYFGGTVQRTGGQFGTVKSIPLPLSA
jgi:hypothetical protein